MTLLRSLLYAAIFYLGTVFYVLAGILAMPFGRRPTLAIILGWMDFNGWLCKHLLGIRSQVVGTIPAEPHLIALKHESMYETTEMVRTFNLPVVVLKRELDDIPLFGTLTSVYGSIPVDREAGAKALRTMVAAGREAAESGRSVIIFPEGTRVPAGETPPLQSGFAGLYRALGLPVLPVAVDSGRLWGRGLVHRPGIVTFKVGEPIPPGLKREEIEQRVHAGINALAPQART